MNTKSLSDKNKEEVIKFKTFGKIWTWGDFKNQSTKSPINNNPVWATEGNELKKKREMNGNKQTWMN